MGQGISEVLTFAVGVAISPVPIIAVTLMLFSQRARVNGPLFPLGWVPLASIDAFTPVKALGLGLLLAGVNPKNLMLAAAAGAGVAQLGLSTGDAVGSLVVFVVVASLTIGAPVGYHLIGGDRAKARLDELKDWLAFHNAAVLAVLFLVLAANLVADGLPPLT